MIETFILSTEPSQPPASVACTSQQHALFVKIQGIPWSEWNGERHGFDVLYKPTSWDQELNVDSVSYNISTLSEYILFQSEVFKDHTVHLDNLNVFTKYEIFIGGRNSVGEGPLRRIVCRTTEGGNYCFQIGLISSIWEDCIQQSFN